ncbi:Cobyric acid synthase [uncultured Thiomicrorhabdus sp.]
MVNCLMIQGCTSDAGKSTVVAGLCRVLQRKGIINAPFKPQNMALNSAVTEDGGEIGRAQALQAIAAKVPSSMHMNPVLLKPNSDTGAQVILQGQSIGNLNAMDYHAYKPKAAQAVFDSFQILSKQYSTILVEGAGSPAEINLRQGDIANMGFAEKVDCPVILVADIDKGGVFAHIVGTLACLSESEMNRIQGLIINRFRGDIALLKDGLDWLEQKTGKPVLGVLPYLHGLHLDAEDSVGLAKNMSDKHNSKIKIIAPLFPHISNHTDVDPLIQHPQIDFQWVRHNQPIPAADLIILPGSKSVVADLNWLHSQGWEKALHTHLRYGGKLIAICGGLQMLGQQLLDPDGIESEQTQTDGLGLMPYSTEFQNSKQLTNKQGSLNFVPDASVCGYEIHQGQSNFADFPELLPAIAFCDGSFDGLISADNQILVTYLHGLFDSPSGLQTLLNWAGAEDTENFDLPLFREQQINRLADCFEKHLDIENILQLASIEAGQNLESDH